MPALGVGIGVGTVVWYYYQQKLKTMRPNDIPGEQLSVHKQIAGAGGAMLGQFKPLNQIHEHLCAFHFPADDMTRQIEAHHFCACLNEDFRQCVIYDSAEPNAKLIGIEYIISEKLYKVLADDEKRLWHSHQYEVRSGLLIAPRVAGVADRDLMKDVVKTYGKTIHTWQVDKFQLPVGEPQLMMSFTEDGQVNPDLVEARDHRLGVSTTEKRKNRALLSVETVSAKADAWQTQCMKFGLEKASFQKPNKPYSVPKT